MRGPTFAKGCGSKRVPTGNVVYMENKIRHRKRAFCDIADAATRHTISWCISLSIVCAINAVIAIISVTAPSFFAVTVYSVLRRCSAVVTRRLSKAIKIRAAECERNHSIVGAFLILHVNPALTCFGIRQLSMQTTATASLFTLSQIINVASNFFAAIAATIVIPLATFADSSTARYDGQHVILFPDVFSSGIKRRSSRPGNFTDAATRLPISLSYIMRQGEGCLTAVTDALRNDSSMFIFLEATGNRKSIDALTRYWQRIFHFPHLLSIAQQEAA